MLTQPVIERRPKDPTERGSTRRRALWPGLVVLGSVLVALAVPVGLFAVLAFWVGDGNGPTVDSGSPWFTVMDVVLVAWVVAGFATMALAVLNAALARRSFDAAAVAVERARYLALRARGRRFVGAAITDTLAAGLFLLLVIPRGFP